MLARLGIGEIIVIGVTAFLIFGPQKLPEFGRSLGETIRNFKDSMNSDADDVTKGFKETEKEEE